MGGESKKTGENNADISIKTTTKDLENIDNMIDRRHFPFCIPI